MLVDGWDMNCGAVSLLYTIKATRQANNEMNLMKLSLPLRQHADYSFGKIPESERLTCRT